LTDAREAGRNRADAGEGVIFHRARPRDEISVRTRVRRAAIIGNTGAGNTAFSACLAAIWPYAG